MKRATPHPTISVSGLLAIKKIASKDNKPSADEASQAWAAIPVPICPVCAGATDWFDVVDFNKNGSEPRGVFLPLAGRPVYYARCSGCGFCFAPALHRWSAQDMASRIYNADYAVVDPDYIEVRPKASADMLCGMFAQLAGSDVPHLDYGSGSGRLSELLQERGWRSISYDPFVPDSRAPDPGRRFGLITAFEVFEHVADVQALMDFLEDHLAPDGLLVFSTLLSDGAIQPGKRLDWWYACPRNGHISLFSKKSLTLLLQRCGIHGFASSGSGFHIACRERWPHWAQHLISNGQQ